MEGFGALKSLGFEMLAGTGQAVWRLIHSSFSSIAGVPETSLDQHARFQIRGFLV